MTCPVCSDTGEDPAGWPDTGPPMREDGAMPTCWCCRGSGELPEGVRWDPQAGLLRRDARVTARYSLRKMAALLCITMAQLSEQERGLWRRG